LVIGVVVVVVVVEDAFPMIEVHEVEEVVEDLVIVVLLEEVVALAMIVEWEDE